jgi:hypothetical protein
VSMPLLTGPGRHTRSLGLFALKALKTRYWWKPNSTVNTDVKSRDSGIDAADEGKHSIMFIRTITRMATLMTTIPIRRQSSMVV